jgi:hypothetical protein
MLDKARLLFMLKYAAISAVLYNIFVILFLRNADFESIYLLYIGNAAFAIGIILHSVADKIAPEERNKGAKKMIRGHVTTLLGVILSCLIALLLLFIMVPELLNTSSETSLEAKPAQMDSPGQGITFTLFMDAVLGNFSTGSFISILLALVLVEKKVVR